MNRTEKQELIDDLRQEFGQSPHAILVDFRGLSVPAVTEFRRKVKKDALLGLEDAVAWVKEQSYLDLVHKTSTIRVIG